MSPHENRYDVTEFGATGDGETICTDGINEAIRECTAADGGVVYIPSGDYLTGTVLLQDDITLTLAPGATLVGRDDLDAYQTVEEGDDWQTSLIQGDGVRNVTIRGQGTIDGRHIHNPQGEENMRGPHAILLDDCHDVTIRDVDIVRASNYAIRLQSCSRGQVRGVTASAGWDGVNMDGCSSFTISDCRFFTGDDCLAGPDWRHVTVTNCVLNTSCNGFRVGGRNITISNCVLYGPGEHEHRTSNRYNTIAGFNTWANAGLENISISNMAMDGVRTPMYLRWSRGREGGVRNLVVEGLTVTNVGRTPFVFHGTDDVPFEGVTLRGVQAEFCGGGTSEQADTHGTSPVATLPFSGLWARYVEDLSLADIDVRFEETDTRPVVGCEYVDQLEVRAVDIDHSPRQSPLTLDSVGSFVVHDSSVRTHVPTATEITVESQRGDDRVVAGESFEVVVTVSPDISAGLLEVPLEIDGQEVTTWTWTHGTATREVVFPEIEFESPGSHRLRVGSTERIVSAVSRPEEATLTVTETDIDTRVREELSATATVRNWGRREGVETAELLVDGEVVTTANCTVPGESEKSYTITDPVDGPATHQVAIDDHPVQTVQVGGPVGEPFEVFTSGDGEFVRFNDGIYVSADGVALSRADRYGTVFRRRGLSEEGTVIVRVRNPDQHGHWSGRAGIAVRNDLTDADESQGYVVLGASPANGWWLEWDGNDDGRIDTQCNEIDDFTLWPHWLKLERSGHRFRGSYRTDSSRWRRIGETEVESAASALDVGIFVYGTSALFSDFEVRENDE